MAKYLITFDFYLHGSERDVNKLAEKIRSLLAENNATDVCMRASRRL